MIISSATELPAAMPFVKCLQYILKHTVNHVQPFFNEHSYLPYESFYQRAQYSYVVIANYIYISSIP